MFVADAPPPASAADPEPGGRSGLADLPLELIEREIESLAAQINAGCARWLELVAEFDRREGWGDTGCRSTSEWVAWRCALTSRSAREHVRVARALPELPEIRRRFGAGELSYSKVRALTRVADSDSEAELCELARHATAAQLERMVRAARRCTAAEADEAQRESFVRWDWDDDGCLRIEATLPPEDGALVLRALECARDALYEVRLSEAAERADGSAGPLAAPGPSGSAEPPRAGAARPQPALGSITPYGPPRAPTRPAAGDGGGSAEPPPVPSPTNAESFAALAEDRKSVV